MASIKVLRILTQPQGARYNAVLTVQPVIQVGDLDTVSGLFAVDTAYVGSVLVTEGAGNASYDLTGILTKPFVLGVATFTNIGFITTSANSLLDMTPAALGFITVNLNTVTSNTFTISNASKLVISSTPVPTSGIINRPLQIPITIQLKDSANNSIPLSGVSITVTAVGANVSGVTTLQSNATGDVTFNSLTLSAGENVILTFSALGLTSATLALTLVYTDIIKPRRSTVPGKTPTALDIVPFEIAINIPDRRMWQADETGTPILLFDGLASGSGGVPSSVPSGVIAGPYTNANITVNTFGIITLADNGTGGGGGGGTAGGFSSNTTAPTSPAQGDRWVNTINGILYTYYGTVWVQFNN